MNTQDEWDDLVRNVNEPPAVPRDRIWARIDAVRQGRRGTEASGGVMRPDFGGADGDRGRWWRLGGAIAAVLILGIAIGRMTVKTPPPGTVAETPVAAGDSVPASAGRDRGAEIYRLAATDLFNSADLRLTDFRARSCGPDEGHEGLSWAAGMLLQTRLLMDTPVADDPTLRPLLDDLELVLAQIIGLSRDDCARDMAFITEGLHKRATLDRLRLAAADGRRHPL